MTGEAISFMVLAMAIVWGTLIAAVIFLIRRPEITTWPDDPVTDDMEDLSMN